jgi:hypothetical protein
MNIVTRAFNASLGQVEQIETEIDVQFRSSVATVADLPTSDNVSGDVRLAIDSDHLFAYVNDAWIDQGVYDVADLLQQRLMQELS